MTCILGPGRQPRGFRGGCSGWGDTGSWTGNLTVVLHTQARQPRGCQEPAHPKPGTGLLPSLLADEETETQSHGVTVQERVQHVGTRTGEGLEQGSVREGPAAASALSFEPGPGLEGHGAGLLGLHPTGESDQGGLHSVCGVTGTWLQGCPRAAGGCE